jgi:hypothetical protein
LDFDQKDYIVAALFYLDEVINGKCNEIHDVVNKPNYVGCAETLIDAVDDPISLDGKEDKQDEESDNGIR